MTALSRNLLSRASVWSSFAWLVSLGSDPFKIKRSEFSWSDKVKIECPWLAVQVVKAVQQNYMPTDEVLVLLEQFRRMVNDCIRIGLTENVTSLKALSLKAYRQLGGYEIPSYYKVCAISAATGILRNHRRALRKGRNPAMPYARRLRLVTCDGFKVKDGHLLLPTRPRRQVLIPLNRHTRSVLTWHRSLTL